MNNDSPQKDVRAGSPHSAIVIAIGDLLSGIPVIGKFLETIWLAWGVAGALLLVCGFAMAVGCAHFVPLTAGIFGKAPVRSILTTYEQVHLEEKAKKAKYEVRASGLALGALNPEDLIKKAAGDQGFSARIVMMNPCGEAVKQRERDEGEPRVAGAKVLEQLSKYRNHAWSVGEDKRKQVNKSLQISLLEAYPTMAVLILDENLHVYFCGYRHRCDQSPALTFENYKKNDSAKYFESRLTASENAARRFLVFGNPGAVLKNPAAPIDCDSLEQYLEK